jgi:hypothetical protein
MDKLLLAVHLGYSSPLSPTHHVQKGTAFIPLLSSVGRHQPFLTGTGWEERLSQYFIYQRAL